MKRLPTNQGVSKALNYGLSVARDIEGVEFIARMDSDDISQNLRIEMQVNYLQHNPSVSICGTAVEMFGEGREANLMVYPS